MKKKWYINDLEVELEGEYIPGQTATKIDPLSPEDFEVHHVWVARKRMPNDENKWYGDQVDILPIMDKQVLEEVVEEILKEWNREKNEKTV